VLGFAATRSAIVAVRQLFRIVDPQPHLCARMEVIRAQARPRKVVLDMLEDDVRLDQEVVAQAKVPQQ